MATVDSSTYVNLQTPPEEQYGDKSAWWTNDNLLNSSSYYKYGMALDGTLDWKEEMKNLASARWDNSPVPTQPTTDVRNAFIEKEKTRIRQQYSSNAYNRQDFFSIGTVYLTIPPTQISISEEKHNFRYKILRGPDSVTASGRATMRIDLEIFFTGIDEINNKLRPLIAQFKCTPFLPIENEYLRSVVDPESIGVRGDIEEAKEDVKTLQKKQEEVESMNIWKAAQAQDYRLVLEDVKSLGAQGTITPEQESRISALVNRWYVHKDVNAVLADPDARTCLSKSPVGAGFTLDLKDYMYKVIRVPTNIGRDISTLTKSINNIGDIQQRIDSMESKINTAFDKDVEKRYRNRRIAGVLSQMSVSTVPGYPDTLSARISMYVFNYDPFTFEFGFVKGYDPENYTPNMTECDIFIDWYANRFLREDKKPGALSLYNLNNYMLFSYAKNISYDELIYGAKPQVIADSLAVDDNTFVTGVSVTMRNIVQFLPILSGERPTCQYMGAYNTSVNININSTNIGKVKQIRSMISLVSRVSRTNNKLGRYNMFAIYNPLVSLMGLKYFILESFSIDTVPGSPGLYSISMEASEIKLDAEKAERINRIGIDNNDRVLDAARYILEKAREYMMDTTPGHQNTSAYRVYYNILYGDQRHVDYQTTPLAQAVKRNTMRKDRGYYPEYYDSEERKSAVKRIKGQYYMLSMPSEDVEPSVYSVDNYISGLYSLMSGGSAVFSDGQTMDWETELKYLTYAFSEEAMQTIKTFLSEESGMMDLKNYAFSRATLAAGAPPHIVDSTAYPDLELPLYKDLGDNADKFKLTYGDVGLLTPNPVMRDKPAQTDWVAIEPDAFFSRMSIYDIIDNTGSPSMQVGMKNWENMATTNRYSYANPLDPDVLVGQIEQSTSLNEDAKSIKIDEVNKIVDKAITAIADEKLLVTKVIDGNTVEVRAMTNLGVAIPSGETFRLRLVDCNVQKYDAGNPEKQPTYTMDMANKNKEILKKVLLNKQIYASIIPNQTWKDDKNVTLAAIASYYDDEKGTLEPIPPKLEAEGATFYDGFDVKADKNVNEDNLKSMEEDRRQAFSEVSIKVKRNTGKSITDNTPQQGRPFALNPTSILKDNQQEVTRVGVQTEIAKGLDDLMSGRYVSSAAVRSFAAQNKNKNSTFERFDRYSKRHMDTIIERITKQSKDHNLRMVRAFPTFKFYFVEEDRMEYKPFWLPGELKNLDEIYSYNAILSIDITKSRKEAADVAVVQILNTKGVLDRDRFGLYDPQSNELQRDYTKNSDRKDKETINQNENIEEFVLKVGTRIKIKMGYSSDPTHLDITFTGQVTEVSMGDVITIVAQGYGSELMKKITGWGTRIRYQDYSAYKILDKIIKRPEITHFGFTEWQPIDDMNLKELYRRYKPQTGPYRPDGYALRHPSMWRDWLGSSWVLRHFADPRNGNIWTPEVSIWAEETKGEGWEFSIENRTVWDIFQEFTRRMPGYVTQVVPFDNRATIYFGPSDGYYNYSNEVRGLVAENRASLGDPDQLFSEAQGSGKIKEMTLDEKSARMEKINAILNRVRIEDGWDDKTIQSNFATMWNSSENVTWILSNAEEYLSNANKEEDRKAIEDFRKINESQGIFFKDNIKTGDIKVSDQNFSIFNSQDKDKLNSLQMYTDEDGRVYDRETYINRTWGENLRVPANFKMLRGYHYVDSLRNIISNNIISTEENMWNRVEVITNSKLEKTTETWKFMAFPAFFSPPNPLTSYTAQADDSIWKESLITKVVNEPNAQTPAVAWMYALGNLRYGINEMYSGYLTVMGDPSIKPNDVVFMNDYYTDMHGAFEVREVTHHFSHDTGFVTSIVPDCICYLNNSMAMATEAVAGGWYDDVANSLNKVYNFKVPFVGRITSSEIMGAALAAGGIYGLGVTQESAVAARLTGLPVVGRVAMNILSRPAFIRVAAAAARTTAAVRTMGTAVSAMGIAPQALTVAGVVGGASLFERMWGRSIRQNVSAMQFAAMGWTVGRREPINILPLIYSSRPYISGIKGLRRSDWWEPYTEAWHRFTYYYTKMAPRYLTDMISSALDDKLSSASWSQRVGQSQGL